MARKLLIVHGCAQDRHSLSDILSDDYVVQEAASGEDALLALRSQFVTISAVLLSPALPDMDGYALVHRIREHAVWRQVPIFVIAEDMDPEEQEQALALGVNGFLCKPYRPTAARCLVRNSIRLRENATIINAIQRDKLTGLYNREAFFEAATKLMKRQKPGYYVLSCFDIDSFKVVNDQYGIQQGDEVLRHVARCLSKYTARMEGICCRFTSDKFGILYPARYAESELLKEAMGEVVAPRCINRRIRIRIGRYYVNELSLPISAMFDRATLAQESIKGRYDVFVSVYSEPMRKRLLHEQQIVAEMYDALRTGQFETWFQPLFNHLTGAMIGAEALIRWRHPKDGLLVPPGDFISVFERNGFIYELDKYVWEQACRLIKQWIDEGTAVVPISVNISRYDVFHNSFVGVITGLVRRYDVPVEMLHLEITESAFVEPSSQMNEKIRELIDLGFVVAIDDFGSGYSSLNTLKDIPATVLKLDMKFLENNENSQRGGNILESIVRMAKWLGMSVIAEGVETIAQADYLKSIGCFYVQGYLYARPIPLPDFQAMVEKAMIEEAAKPLEIVETLDNSAFWDPRSMDTLIFNSYVGGACIIEYQGDRAERIRANDRYYLEFDGRTVGGKPVWSMEPRMMLDPENLCVVRENIRQAIRTRKESTCEIRISGLDGGENDVLYLRCTVRMIAATTDRSLLYCVVSNITLQRLAEEKERRLARQLQTIIDNMVGGVAAIASENGKLRFLMDNEQFYTQLGYTREQFHSEVSDYSRLIHPEDWPKVCRMKADFLQEKRPVSLTYRAFGRDGGLRWMESSASSVVFPDSPAPVTLVVINDITGLKEAEEHLCFLNSMAHGLLEQPDVETGLNAALIKLMDFFNGKRAYIFEIDENMQTARNTYEVCAPGVAGEIDTLQSVPLSCMSFWLDAFESENFCYIPSARALDDSWRKEKEFLIAQGIETLVAIPLRNGGRLIGFLGIDDGRQQQALVGHLTALADYITVMLIRRDLNRQILRNNENVRRMLDDIPGGFHRLRVLPDGGLKGVYANKSFCAMVGMTPAEVADQYREDVFQSVHPGDAANVRETVGLILGDGQVHDAIYRLRKRDGDYLRVRAYGRAVTDSKGDTYLNVFFADVSAQKK